MYDESRERPLCITFITRRSSSYSLVTRLVVYNTHTYTDETIDIGRGLSP